MISLVTEICDLLQIEYPIIQGGMAWVSTASLVSAVSEAGGLGIIGSGQMPPELMEQEIIKVKETTSKPYGVNVMLLHPEVDKIFEIILRHDVPVVTTGAGNPGKYIPILKEKGIKVIPVVPSTALAKRMEKLDADAIIVEGTEAGGHIGELTTFTLVPQVVDVVKIPVIAAGGIADGRGMAAALALGAKGIQMGTRFMASVECGVHPAIKEKIIMAKDRDTMVTGRSTGHPARVLKNKLSKEMDILDKQNKIEEFEQRGIGSVRKAMVEGDMDNGSLMAGQISGMINEILPVKEIINNTVSQCSSILCSFDTLCVQKEPVIE
jgi:enoyl-[acyl-carrier protein] reductase II